MKLTEIKTGIIIIIIIVIIYNQYNLYGGQYEEYISGFWIGDDEFNDEAGVDSMMLYIGEREYSYFSWKNSTRDSYLTIRTADDTNSNQILQIKYRSPGSGISHKIGKYILSANIEYEEVEVFPTRVFMEFDMLRGMLRIYDDETIYGIFYKDNLISDSL